MKHCKLPRHQRFDHRAPRCNTGLQPGDVVHSVNNDFVYNVDGLRAAMSKFKTGDPVALLIERGEQLLYVAFELP